MSKPPEDQRFAEARERADALDALYNKADRILDRDGDVVPGAWDAIEEAAATIRLLLSELDRVTGERDEARADAKLCADSWVREIESNNARRDDLKAVWDMLNRYDAPTLDDGDGAPLSLAGRVEAMVYRDAVRALAAEADRDRMRSALERIERWHGEFPETGRTWNDEAGTPMSYGACYGSNGERDFMRGIARAALIEGKQHG